MGDMSSPVRRENNQPTGNRISTEVGTRLAARNRFQQLLPMPAAEGSNADPDDLVARALALLEREQERWQDSRSQNNSPGNRL
jgi:hypothetical protein